MKISLESLFRKVYQNNYHPCGDCANYGDTECMKHKRECEYSDKTPIINNYFRRYLKWS